jgi:hypothetical protein
MTEKIEVKNNVGVLAAKVYFSPDQQKIRFVLPTLNSFAQVKIDTDNHLIDVTLDAKHAEGELEARQRNYFRGKQNADNGRSDTD